MSKEAKVRANRGSHKGGPQPQVNALAEANPGEEEDDDGTTTFQEEIHEGQVLSTLIDNASGPELFKDLSTRNDDLRYYGMCQSLLADFVESEAQLVRDDPEVPLPFILRETFLIMHNEGEAKDGRAIIRWRSLLTGRLRSLSLRIKEKEMLVSNISGGKANN